MNWARGQNIIVAISLLQKTFSSLRRRPGKKRYKIFVADPQGWKVTEKGMENVLGWKALILNNSFYIGVAILSILFCVVSWIIRDDMKLDASYQYLGLLFVNINILLCIISLGKKEEKHTMGLNRRSLIMANWKNHSNPS